MTLDQVVTLHVNRPSNRHLRRRIRRCFTCECCTEFVVRCELWYSACWMCCRCGDSWTAGEGRDQRPFHRNWRRDAVRRHRRMWDVATYGAFPTLHELDPVSFPNDDVADAAC